jgi:hypothetical protein
MIQEELMTMTPLLTARDAGAPAWAGVPPLATCSYDRYERAMGTAVRITRFALRGVALPNPRFTDQPHWPVVRGLIPAEAIFHQGLPHAEFAALYRNDLAHLSREQPGQLEDELRAIPLDPEPAEQRLVLLCYEEMPGAALSCHRRVFAAWWTARTGWDVPELG